MDHLGEHAIYSDLNGPWRPVMGNSVNPGRKGSSGFLQKLFSRQPSMPKLVTAGLEDQIGHLSLNNSTNSSNSNLEVMPCPYIRPLGIRLEPRVENGLGRPPTDSGTSLSRKKRESPGVAHSYLPIGKPEGDPQRNVLASDVMTLRGLRQRDDTAAAATAGSSHLKDWGHYIKCYSEGRYSLTVPPGPPPMNSNFTYLPSPYPPNESERLAAFQSLHIWSGVDIDWSSLEAERARHLIKAAATKFGTPWAAISFFDDDTEIVQAERGYSRHVIPRRESIASHVLLTDEVMTVLDTQKDWRFVGNPLVTGNPKIRFFAGAPLLSSNSQVIGVFAVFSPEPRRNFTPMQRRDLTSISELATRDLTAKGEGQTGISDQSSPTLQGTCHDGGASSSRPASSLQSSIKSKRYGISPVAFQYHKTPQEGKSQDNNSRSRVFIASESQDMSLQNLNYTPPTSDDSDAGPSTILEVPKGFGKNRKQLSLAAWSNQPQDPMETPDSPTFGGLAPQPGKPQPRAFSLSDLTSVDQKPLPRTPDVDYMNDSSSRSPVEYRRNKATFSPEGAVVLLTPHPNSPFEQISDISSVLFDTKERGALLDKAVLFGEILDAKLLEECELSSISTPEAKQHAVDAVKNDENHLMKSSFSANLTPRKVDGLVGIQAEARFAAELWAKNLTLDIIYAVELIPKWIFMSESELKVPGNVETRILVSYGLDDMTDFDIPIHLKVLRGSGAMTWQNDDGIPKEYSRGFMMPLVFEDGMLNYRSSGVVFGAFRRTPDGIKESPRLKSAEVDRLIQAANVLKDILAKSPSLRWPNQCEREPPSMPSPQPHLENKAIEVGKYSLDACTARFTGTRKRCRRRLKSHD